MFQFEELKAHSEGDSDALAEARRESYALSEEVQTLKSEMSQLRSKVMLCPRADKLTICEPECFEYKLGLPNLITLLHSMPFPGSLVINL